VLSDPQLLALLPAHYQTMPFDRQCLVAGAVPMVATSQSSVGYERLVFSDQSSIDVIALASPWATWREQPLWGEQVLAQSDSLLLLAPRPVPTPLTSPDHYAALGRSLGQFHRDHRGTRLDLPLRDALWFSRATPYVLAEVAERAAAGDYRLSMTSLAALEEVGIIISDLTEPLTGLLPTVVHGQCDHAHLSLATGQPQLWGWERACLGLGWLDLANIASEIKTEGDGREAETEKLLALLEHYADAAGYPLTVLADFVPFCMALSDVLYLDHLNGQISRQPEQANVSQLEARVQRLIALAAP
jgi:hypothetical protein